MASMTKHSDCSLVCAYCEWWRGLHGESGTTGWCASFTSGHAMHVIMACHRVCGKFVKKQEAQRDNKN